uniref:CD180 molecule n=1 Tax=Cavia porcellus TaxID=10141 RepID=A0A286Y297_CAVPO
MAPDVSCIFLAVLLSASCEVITSADQMCIEEYPVWSLSQHTIKTWKVCILEATIFPQLNSPKTSQQGI